MRRYSSAVLFVSLIAAVLMAPSLAVAAGCEDYLTQREAQARLRADPTDPEGLDPDNNGIACDRNPPPYDTTPVARPVLVTPTTTPEPGTPVPSEEPAAPEEEPEGPAANATPTPSVRSPLLGPEPPPLMYLQGGAPPPYVRSGQTTATPSTLAYVQGADSSIGPAVMQRAIGVIQPPNTGDGGLLNE